MGPLVADIDLQHNGSASCGYWSATQWVR